MSALDKYNLSFSISSGNEIPRLLMKPTRLRSIFKDRHDHRWQRRVTKPLTGPWLRAVVQYLLTAAQRARRWVCAATVGIRKSQSQSVR